MSSPLQRLNLGRKPAPASDRAAMLSRLGIAEETPRDLFRAPDPEPEPPAPQPEPAAQPALSRAPDPAPQPEPEPAAEPVRQASWSLPANDEHIPPPPVEAPRPAPQASAPVAPPSFRAPAVEEDPIEAIRRQYRKAAVSLPRPDFQLPNVQLPNVHLPNVQLPNVHIPNVKFNVPRAGERRRKNGELGAARQVIWIGSVVVAVLIAGALMMGDESNAVVQAFGALLPGAAG
ncbi:MAG TPA: hypothetical protein VF122_04600 [Caulobacteraceae bacterium]